MKTLADTLIIIFMVSLIAILAIGFNEIMKDESPEGKANQQAIIFLMLSQ